MAKTKKNEGNQSKNVELRQDLITREWILFFIGGKEGLELEIEDQPKKKIKDHDDNCHFCEPSKKDLEADTLVYNDKDNDWSLRVTPNSDSILSEKDKFEIEDNGPYRMAQGNGIHEYVITKSHKLDLEELPNLAIAEAIDSLTDRYLNLMKNRSIKYISIGKNSTKNVELFLEHPHLNIYGFPFIPAKIYQELKGAKDYYQENHRCPYCLMNEFEIENKKERIIEENSEFIAYCPYVSKNPFEIRISPLEHKPYFERINDKSKINFASILQNSLKKLNATLNNPEYSFYLQTSPCDGQDYKFNHWNLTIIPKTPIIPKFELGIEMKFNTIRPSIAAKYLKQAL